MGSPIQSLKGQCWQGLGMRVVTPPITKTKPMPGSATSLLAFALRNPKTDLQETGAVSPILMVFHETLFCPVLSK